MYEVFLFVLDLIEFEQMLAKVGGYLSPLGIHKYDIGCGSCSTAHSTLSLRLTSNNLRGTHRRMLVTSELPRAYETEKCAAFSTLPSDFRSPRFGWPSVSAWKRSSLVFIQVILRRYSQCLRGDQPSNKNMREKNSRSFSPTDPLANQPCWSSKAGYQNISWTLQ